MNEDRLAEENARLRDQLRREAEALDELRRERAELRREREHEPREAEARVHELLQRAEAAETRVAELEAEIGEGILGRLRALCKAVRNLLQAQRPAASPGAGQRRTPEG